MIHSGVLSLEDLLLTILVLLTVVGRCQLLQKFRFKHQAQHSSDQEVEADQ